MKQAIDGYWNLKLLSCKKALEKNNFEVFTAGDLDEAEKIFFQEILPDLDVKTVSWGDSLTFLGTGILDYFQKEPDVEVIEINKEGMSWDESIANRRKSLLTDLFCTGTNALTEDGRLVNLDMIGNRTAGIIFGPLNVVIFTGRNKIVPDLDAAFQRVRQYAAPVNAMRFQLQTPCVKTGECSDCRSSDRICNVWTVSEKSYPEKRVKVILINEDLGF